MKYIVDSQEMKQYDQNTMEHFKIPSMVLMERAALCFTQQLARELVDSDTILVVCGSGNNGGDGIAIARLFYLQGRRVKICLVGNQTKASPQQKQQLAIAESYGVPVVHKLEEATVLVDAIFGVGLSREIQGPFQKMIEQMNAMTALKVAVDISSGISADNGQVLGGAFQASLTITFGFQKKGHLLYPGADYCGRVVLCDMGIDQHSFLGTLPTCHMIEQSDYKVLPVRPAYSHKGTFGKVLLIAGRKNMAGACIFAARAAYQAGCGLVKIYTVEENREILQQSVPQALLETYDPDTSIEDIQQVLQWSEVIAIGPGIGTDLRAETLVQEVLKTNGKKVILDADALNILAHHMDWLKATLNFCVVTPHLLEMSRMIQRPVPYIQGHLTECAKELARNYQVVCVLKDARTITADWDGNIWINPTGNSGMAVGGSGDILTGLLAGMAAQHMDLKKTTALFVYLHGDAGDRAAAEIGEYSLQPQDILKGIAAVLSSKRRKMESGNSERINYV